METMMINTSDPIEIQPTQPEQREPQPMRLEAKISGDERDSQRAEETGAVSSSKALVMKSLHR